MSQINKVHCRALGDIYQKSEMSLSELLDRDKSVSVHNKKSLYFNDRSLSIPKSTHSTIYVGFFLYIKEWTFIENSKN